MGWLLVGCDRKPTSSGETGGTPPGPKPIPPVKPVEPPTVAMDAQDAPDAPRAIPKSHELHGWIKSDPVRVFPASDLASGMPDPARRALLTSFHLQRLARCAYLREGSTETAAVLFIEAASPEDAFGVFSVTTTQLGTLHKDGTIRATEQDGETITVSGWQGNVFAQVRCRTESGKAPAPEDGDLLLASILFNVPSADPPWLLRAIQSEKGEAKKLWVVRSTAALVASHHPVLSQIDPAVMDARLGLKGEQILAVAAVQVGPGEPPNLVWLAQYRQPADAQAANDRYQKALGPDATGLDANTLVHEPKGAYLAGSWTADQESIQHQLTKLGTILPG